MMRLLKIAKSGLGARPAGDADELDGHEQVEEAFAPEDAAVAEGVAVAATPEDAAPAAEPGEDQLEAADEPGEEGSSDDISDELDSEIGAILAMIRSRKPGDGAPVRVPEETGATYQLLSELDRIWRSA